CCWASQRRAATTARCWSALCAEPTRRRIGASIRPFELTMTQFAQYPSLRDRVVFITGGGSGIGAAITENFAQQGSHVAFVDIDQESSRALVKKIEQASVRAPLFMPCDVRDIEALRAAIGQTQKTFGDISVLVNNAARDDRHKIEDVTIEYWD